MTLIFLVAWGRYRVPLASHLVPFFVVTVAAAVSAAGLALLLTTACRTKRQAQTFANVAILTVSAVGGSMVPRFLMPAALKAVGWLTPTTWAIEAYSGIFWRQQPITAIWLPIALLSTTGLVALAGARLLAARDERL